MEGVSLHMFMGRELETLTHVPAGNVFGLGGVGHCLLKTGTVSTVANVIPFRQMMYQVTICVLNAFVGY